jgi:catechol 2,3-dioxygenase-like lactoylglutathione lyase family enzyme
MPRVVRVDHLVLSVGDLAPSKDFYSKVLGFKVKYDHSDMVGWSNRKTLFWVAQTDAQEGKRKHHTPCLSFQ